MALLPVPGTPGNPAQLGQQVALFADSALSPVFGVTQGKVELESPSSGIQVLPDADVLWSVAAVVAKLPPPQPGLTGPFTIRVKPPAPAPALETPLDVLVLDVAGALNDLKDRLRVLVELGEEVSEAVSGIVLQPAQQPLQLKVVPAPDAGFALRSLPVARGRSAQPAPPAGRAGRGRQVPRPHQPAPAPRKTIAETTLGSLDLGCTG